MVFSVQGTGFDGPTREQRVHVSKERRWRGCRKRDRWLVLIKFYFDFLTVVSLKGQAILNTWQKRVRILYCNREQHLLFVKSRGQKDKNQLTLRTLALVLFDMWFWSEVAC